MYHLLGIEINPMTINEMHTNISNAIKCNQQKYIITSQNLHSIFLYHRDPKMQALQKRACKRVDGMPLILWGKILGYPLHREQRVTWVDWIGPFLKEACDKHWKIFYLGSKPDVASSGVDVIRKQYNGLQLEYSHGYFDNRPYGQENQNILNKIAASSPDILMVGMGMPRQEHWIYDNLNEISAKVILTCGAAMEYVAKAVTHPPRWMGNCGLEWLYRFGENPQRFWSRYFIEPWFLVPYAMKDIADKIKKQSTIKTINKKLPENALGKMGRAILSNALFFLNDEMFIYSYYYLFRGRSTRHLKMPVMLSDKFNWIKLYYRHNWMSNLVDKYNVRDYVKSRIGGQYLIDLYFVGEKLTENDYNRLPAQFVLKATHASGLNMICVNKNELSYKSVNNTVTKWLRTNYYQTRREWAYKNVKPRLIAEKFLAGSNGEVPEDYKICCFNGNPQFIQVDFDRFSRHTQCFYDTDWTKLPIFYGNIPSYMKTIPKPINFEKMLEIASQLSNGLPFARIDLYNVNGTISFGEITLYPAGGSNIFHPIEYEYHYGEMLKLQELNIYK